jgi:hypothetical protein
MLPLPTALSELAGRIRDAVATATLDLYNSMCLEIEYRYICWVIESTIIEHL